MKKRKILTVIFILEIVLLVVLKSFGFKAETNIGNFIGILLVLTPLVILLLDIALDKNCSKAKRIISAYFAVFLTVAFVLASIITFLV